MPNQRSKIACLRFNGGRGFGPVAQLGERCVRNAEVEGSTPFRSTQRPSSPGDGGRSCLAGVAAMSACGSGPIFSSIAPRMTPADAPHAAGYTADHAVLAHCQNHVLAA